MPLVYTQKDVRNVMRLVEEFGAAHQEEIDRLYFEEYVRLQREIADRAYQNVRSVLLERYSSPRE